MEFEWFNDGYLDDDGFDEYDDDSESRDTSNSVDIQNKIIITGPAFFRLANYTENAKPGETVTLKCDVENLNGKWL